MQHPTLIVVIMVTVLNCSSKKNITNHMVKLLLAITIIFPLVIQAALACPLSVVADQK